MWQAVPGCVSFLPAGSHVLLLCAHSTDSFFRRVCGQPAKHPFFFRNCFFFPFFHVCRNCDPLMKPGLRLDMSDGEFGHSGTRADSIVTSLGVSCHTMWHSVTVWHYVTLCHVTQCDTVGCYGWHTLSSETFVVCCLGSWLAPGWSQDTCVWSRQSQNLELGRLKWKQKLNWHSRVENLLFSPRDHIFRQFNL